MSKKFAASSTETEKERATIIMDATMSFRKYVDDQIISFLTNEREALEENVTEAIKNLEADQMYGWAVIVFSTKKTKWKSVVE